MMRWIIGASLRFRLLVVGIAAVSIAVGVAQLHNEPVDVLPEFSPPYVEVQTEALGLSAEEVEQLVTVPLEADLLNGTKGVTVLRSESVPSMSSITLLFEPGTSITDARQLVQEQLTQAHANPNVSAPPSMLQPVSSQSRVMIIGLSSNKLTPIQQSVLARWTIRPHVMGVDGVANVSIFGLRDKQLQALVNPDRLKDNGVTLNQVIRTAGNAQLVSPLSFLEASTPGTGGFVDTQNQRLQVRHILPTVTPAQLAKVPIEGATVENLQGSAESGPQSGPAPRRNGKALRLGDVTRVVEGHPPLIGDAVVNDGDGMLLVVEKFPGANTLDVTRDVKDALDEIKPGLAGMQVDSSIFRPADYIEKSIDNLTLAVILASLLLALAFFAFLFAWRAALICFVSFAVSMVTAALVLSFTESTFNALVFAGLAVAVAIVVDDAVIDVENIRRRLAARGKDASQVSKAAIVLEAGAEMRSPMGYATLIVLLAALPVFFIEGVSGSFFEPLARSYALAVLASMLIALTLTPALSLMLLSKPARGGGSPIARWPERRYGSALASAIKKPRLVLVVAGVAALVGLAVIPALGGPVIPSFKDRDFVVRMDGPPGTSRQEMRRIVARASRELRSVPSVRDVGAHVGRAVTGDQVVDVNSSEIWVRVDPDADYGKAKAAINDVVAGYPGITHQVLSYEKQRIRDVASVDDRQSEDTAAQSADLDVLTGVARRPLLVRVYGEDLSVLRAQAARMRQLLSQVGGVVDPRVEPLTEQPTVAIEVSLEKAQRYGIKAGDVRRAEATLLQGIVVGSLFEKQKLFDVVVRGTPELSRSLTDIRRLLIDTPNGGHVRLGSVASVRIRPTLQSIPREASSRRIDVTADVSGRSLGGVQDDVKRRIHNLTFPLEYHAQVIGDATGTEASAWRLAAFGLVAAIGIFLLLQSAFGSWRLASAMTVALPLALVGGELAALIAGGTVSLGALAGFLAVFAIAARNGVSMVTHYQRLERHEGATHGPELVMRGARDRLAPILMTASATAIAILPLIVLGNRQGYEVVHPMAIVVVGGLVTSTLLSLFVVPALYLRFGGKAPSAMAPELELLHRWAGVEPTPVDQEAVSAAPDQTGGDGAVERNVERTGKRTGEAAVDENGRAPAASGAQVEEGSRETDKAQQ
jgi:Cu/Ag efflux pump CusA